MSEEKTTTRRKAVEKVVAAPPLPVVVEAPRRVVKRISFEQWAAARNIRPSHMRGLKAHAGDVSRPRTAAEWDALFATY